MIEKGSMNEGIAVRAQKAQDEVTLAQLPDQCVGRGAGLVEVQLFAQCESVGGWLELL